ncbi:MAG: phosphotransferase [Planctomycetes bacterium]|nr:phosphotransferase [Planctomycetota bacterium]
MATEYLGILQSQDPLHGFLTEEVLGKRLGVAASQSIFDVSRLDAQVSNWSVFHYVDRQTSVHFVGKFFGNKWLHNGHDGDLSYRATLMHREFDNLQRLLAMGFDAGRNQVVRPLATNEAINCLLVETFASGCDLRIAISKACLHGKGDTLRDQLTEVARFLAALHGQPKTGKPLSEEVPLSRFGRVSQQLLQQQIISPDRHRSFKCLCDRWSQSGLLGMGREVLTHGDVGPAHFMFNWEGVMTVLDFENLTAGDQAADLGQMAAALKHLFFWHCGDLWASEPYIQHLYASYAQFVGADADEFSALTTRGRFHMACRLAGMGQHRWLSPDYRRRLIADAEEILAI